MWFWSVSWSTNCPVFFSFFLVDQKKNLVDQKFPETDQKFPEIGQFFFWSTKIDEKKTEQLVDQETDQNHMDGTYICLLVL